MIELINGVTLLSTEVHEYKDATTLQIILIALAAVMVFGGIIAVITCASDGVVKGAVIGTLVIIAGVFTIIITSSNLKPYTQTKYYVSISNDVSMNEFTKTYSHFEKVGELGNLYVITEDYFPEEN